MTSFEDLDDSVGVDRGSRVDLTNEKTRQMTRSWNGKMKQKSKEDVQGK